MMCLPGYKQKLEHSSIALTIARVVEIQGAASCTIVPVFIQVFSRDKSTELGLLREFLLSREKHIHRIHNIALIDSAMALFTPHSIARTPTADTEDDSIDHEAPPSATGKRRATPFDRFRARESSKDRPDDQSIIDEFICYNDRLASSPHCIHRVQSSGMKKEKNCCCLHVLNESPSYCEVIAQYQMYFGQLKRADQQRIFVDWIRNSLFHFNGHQQYHRRHAHLSFGIPFLLSEDDNALNGGNGGQYDRLRDAKICRDALMDILGLGKLFWETCLRHVRCNTLPEYKAKGRKSNIKERWNAVFFDSLVQHFEELRKEAGPIATRFVRERTGETTTRDDNEDAEYLTPDFSKRQCYYQYCLSRGVRVTANNKGLMLKENVGDTSLPVPSWGSYHSFWKREYPNLRVSRPVEDICSYCYTFQNKFRYKKQPQRAAGVNPSSVDDSDDSDVDIDNGDGGETPYAASPPCPPLAAAAASSSLPSIVCLPATTEEVTSDEEDHEEEQEKEEDVDEEVLEREREIVKAVKHVKMARAQRLLVNDKTRLARETRSEAHENRVHTFIVDYGQNMALPWFGTSQPGDTYYYTPLNVYNLGVVDVSHPDGEHLYCHIYKEGDGKKGGDNVASLLMKSLKQLNIIQEGKIGKELNVVFDNCPGQNKNHHVLWLVPYLVEMGLFETVNFIFLVVGHTKNAADRRFNNLKMVYRKSNVYTFKQLLEVCGKSPHVTVVPVVDGDFKDYDYFLGLFYSRISGIKKSHIFSCKRHADGVYTDGTKLIVSVKESNLDDHPTKDTNLLWHNMMLFNADGTEGTFQEAVASRLSLLQRADFLDHIPFKGIPEFKQVQLYKNYRKFIPGPVQDEMCPKPSAEVMKRQKDDQKRRVDEKKEAKAKVH
jgi:hypothetical protein